MNNLQKVIEESNKEFDGLINQTRLVKDDNWATKDIADIKSFISQRDQKILSAIEKEAETVKKVNDSNGRYNACIEIQNLLKSAKENIK